jgi:hypothetical protein
VIQGVRHRTLVVEGVQFHPESILTEFGYDMLRNVLQWDAAVRKDLSVKDRDFAHAVYGC